MLDEVLSSFGLSANNSGAGLNGLWQKNLDCIAVLNPSDNSLLAKVGLATKEDMQQAIKIANKAFLSWRLVPAPKRGEVVWAIGQALRQQKSELGSLVSLETGKSKAEGDGEVQEMIDMADFAVGQSRMLYGLTMPSERHSHRMYEQWLPLGVVGVITAFNFPVAVWAWNAFLAMICGDAVIWKPSVKAPLSALAVINICWQVLADFGYPLGVLSIIVSDDEAVINSCVDNKSVAMISFTGSTNIGRKVGEKVAQRMGRCLLELGGNNAAIVMPDANLAQAVAAIVFGAIGTAGQRCTSLRRLFIHKEVYQRLVDLLINAYKQIKVGNPLDSAIHMGPLIDQNAVINYQNLIKQVQDLDGDICFGGNVLAKKGNFVAPTLVKASMDWHLLSKENFVPILWLIEVDSLEQAMIWHNQADHGLSSAIFTENIKNIEYFLSAKGSDCGIACINQSTSGAEIGGAFGGEKQTGGGRESGSDSWKNYMRRQTVTINYSDQIILSQGIKW